MAILQVRYIDGRLYFPLKELAISENRSLSHDEIIDDIKRNRRHSKRFGAKQE